jgi:hypothetical protein
MEPAGGTFTQIDDMTDGDLHELFLLIRGESGKTSLGDSMIETTFSGTKSSLGTMAPAALGISAGTSE